MTGDGSVPPSGGNVNLSIPRSWLVVGAILVGAVRARPVRGIFHQRAIAAGSAHARLWEHRNRRVLDCSAVDGRNLAGSSSAAPGIAHPLSDTELPALPTATLALGPKGQRGDRRCILHSEQSTPDRPVVEIVDGDTIKVTLDADAKTYTLRYIGMDTAEMNPPGLYMAAEAKARNEQLAYGKSATLIKDVSEVDRYDRLLRYVIVDNVFINYQLVAEGYARCSVLSAGHRLHPDISGRRATGLCRRYWPLGRSLRL